MKTTKVIYLACLLALLPSCGKDRGAFPSFRAIGVSSFSIDEDDLPVPGTRAGENVDPALQPLFVFWTDGRFDDPSVNAPYFFTRIPEGEIDSYATTVYNTGVPYPLHDRVVHAAGLAPAPGDGRALVPDVEGGWSSFTIAGGPCAFGDDEHGVVDVLTAPSVSGSDSAPITMPLAFGHALTKISFGAVLAETMTKFVKYVTVTFPGDLAPVGAVWDADESRYEVVRGEDGNDDFVFGNYWTDDGRFLSTSGRANSTHYYMPSKDKVSSMGFLHVFPPESSEMTVTVNYKMCGSVGGFDKPDPDNPVRDVSKEVTLRFVDSVGDPVILGAGDSYQMTLVFDANDIEIVGQLRDWGDGGHVSLSVQPTK